MVIISLLAVSAVAQTAPKLPFLSPIFTSHMVLQRDRPNPIWGWTTPGATVSVRIGTHRASGKAAVDGKWTVRIDPPATGGPYSLDVDGPEKAHLDDVLVGDVWVCSGQSNMEMGVGSVNNAAAEQAAANYPNIRLFTVERNPSLLSVNTVTGTWTPCSPQTVGGFSAAGYFFGRELHKRLNIPIGLVETCWGGTVAEAWTSRQGLSAFPEFKPAFTAIDSLLGSTGNTASDKLSDWMAANDAGSAAQWWKPESDISGWKASEATPSYEANGMAPFDGVVWFRTEVTLPDPLPQGAESLQLGFVDDMDTTWVNGVKVGEHYAVNDWRNYPLPAGVLKPGRNVVVVRVLDTGGLGGMNDPRQQVLWLAGQATPITGWRYMAGADLKSAAKLPPMYTGDPNVPTVLYNGMIAPIIPLGIKGAIWYQGESNADRAKQYQSLLPAMIADWRGRWGEGDFPFMIVQLANFSTRHSEPANDAWAELREAQALTVARVPNTGLAVAIDIGDGRDIHPKNKQDVGVRLALAALHVAYNQKLAYSGPIFRAATREGSSMRVRFDHIEGGLRAAGDKLAGFQVAGADHKFYWADARIDGDAVIVSAPQVAQPMWVRYAWDMNPEASLYNGANLPAVPFRTDGK